MEEIWHDAQELGIPWSPIRLPEENPDDVQWQSRATFSQVEHPELGESYTYTGAPMLPNECDWRQGPRAPLIGEHNQAVFCEQLGLSQEELTALKEKGIV